MCIRDRLTAGTNQYTLNAYDVDIVSAVVRQTISGTTTDLQLNRVGRTEFLNIPDKASTGRPTQYFLDRATTPVLNIWPTPDTVATYTLITNRVTRIDDVTASNQDPDVPSRFMPCMVSGLAYYLAMKKNPDKAPMLKQQYEQDFKFAADEDGTKVSLHLVPRRSYY